MNEPSAPLVAVLDAHARRHRLARQPLVEAFIRITEDQYAQEVAGFLDVYRRDRTLRPLLEPVLNDVRGYLLWLTWLGWNVSDLAPVLYPNDHEAPARLSLGMLAYASGRLIDDGLDDHESYKGRRQTVVGALRARLPGAPGPVACVQSAYIGFSLFHYALARMRGSNYHEGAGDASRMFEALSIGVLAERLAEPPVEAAVYHHIVRRKSVAYNMILYKSFLSRAATSVRDVLLQILAEMDELAQLVNDFRDVEEDGRSRVLNAVSSGVYNRDTLGTEIERRMRELWTRAESLPVPLPDALAAMFRSVVTPYVNITAAVTR